MKKRFLSFAMAVCLICLVTLTSCSAAEVPADNGGTNLDSAVLTSAVQPVAAFTDVLSDAWYAEAVEYCQGKGLMAGTSDTTFAPDTTLTRAMLVTILWRQAEKPVVNYLMQFSDIPEGQWYSEAVRWAASEKLVAGYGDGRFGANDPITQKQLKLIFQRYTDRPVTDGIPGFDGSSKPATRAQAAAAVMNYAQLSQRDTGWVNGLDLPKAAEEENKMYLQIGDTVWTATLEDNPSATAWKGLLAKGPLTVDMSDYGGFEKVGSIGTTLTQTNRQITTKPGDIILYQGSSVTIYYDQNTWNFTLLGHIDGVTEAELRQVLQAGGGNVSATFSLEQPGDSRARMFNFETKSVTLNSGYTMPINGLGTYSLHGETCVNSVKSALRSGVRLIDTASAYGNEEEVGQAIREAIDEGIIKREDVFVATKIYPGSEMANPEQSIQACLDRLDIGYVDMMLLHHPDQNDVKAYRAMEKFVEEGKIRSLGLSNWYVKELGEFLPQVTITPALVQNEIHPYYQENDVIPYIQDLGIVVQGWYPLGGRGYTAELLENEVVSGIAKAHNVSSAQVILRWNLQKGVVVIPGSSNPDHIKENAELYGFELTDAEMARINALDRNEKHDWY